MIVRMAEIRCPMCGKLNPAERDTCLYCQARLKAITGSGFSTGVDSDSSFGLQDESESSGGGLPDWLQAIRDGDQPSEGSENEPLPDWITGEGSGGFEDEEPSEKIEVPDWLNQLRQEGEKVHTSALSEEKLNKAPIDDEPEWLRKIRLEQSKEVSPERKPAPPIEPSIPSFPERPIQFKAREEPPKSELPDWVMELGGKSAISDEPLSSTEKIESSTEEILFEQKEEEGSLLAWLSTLEKDSTAHAIPPSKEPVTTDKPKEDLVFSSKLPEIFGDIEGFEIEKEKEESLDLLRRLEEKPAEKTGQTPSPFTFEEEVKEFGELPDWLGGISDEEKITPEAEPSLAAKQELTPASLPDWLEAFAPVESIEKPGVKIPFIEPTDKEERAGPLAGLYSVLPAEPDIAKPRKPAEKIDTVDVTEKQRHQISVFESLLASEGLPTITGEKPIIASQNVFRMIIFLALCVAAIVAMVLGIQLAVAPNPPIEILDTINVVNTISNGAPVLLAVDYQPAYSGEMEAGLSVLLERLMGNNVNLAMVSTNPSGPAQIERLLNRVNNERNFQYTPKEKYVTLGYIPGGSTGLSGFATQPRRIFNQGADGKSIWGTTWLNNINKISDFSLVVVATDDSDTARAWVEQVQPLLENKPLIMVVSAQAEPMIRPYYENTPKQVNGMVVGLTGSVAFEQIINRPGAAAKYWSPYNVVVIIAIIMIGLGSVYMIVVTLRKHRPMNSQES